ncbi:hypothetical protein QJS04_geneDACA003998 [Acorus gramineus]|uniref:RecA family profile 1 domain-containing protein n=1 Tax=Acorus gramineus TaxID=55184 RepID=A0AAV9BFF5_ACOGR|nr:hypothetical protein QJS04_geneDACA003998 [Acorus gramineus]
MVPFRAENPLDLPNRKCTVGCPNLDALLDGGVPCASVTELASESGCGKTQLCLQLLLCAQLPESRGGLSSASLCLFSEPPFPLRRLQSLSLSFFGTNDPLDHIYVRGVHSADDLLATLDRVDSLLSNPPSSLPIGLIVIDSIAALFRSDFDNNPVDLRRRSSLFFRIASKLKAQARRHGAAVVVTNQVVDVVGSDGGVRVGNYAWLGSSGRRVCPALGLAWANCVNTRLFLSREEVVVASDGSSEESARVCRTRRWIRVAFAPHLPESAREFVIVREGVFGLLGS